MRWPAFVAVASAVVLLAPPVAGEPAPAAAEAPAGEPAAGASADAPAGAADDAGVGPVGPEARKLYGDGHRAFRAGDYVTAIDRFNDAYRLTRAPGLLYDLAQAHRLNGDCAQALDFYRRYVAARPSGGARARADARIVEMQACAAASAEAAAARGDTNPEAAAAPAAATAAAPPPVPSTASAISASLTVAAPPARPLRRPLGPRRIAGMAVGAVAVGLLSSSGYYAWQADQSSDRVSQVFDRRDGWDVWAAGVERDGRRSVSLAYITGGAGLVAAGIAAWLLARP